MAGIAALVDAKQAGRYHGEISVNSVISDPLVPRLHDFVRFLEQCGVESVYLSFPWYISDETATAMDHYVAANLPHMTAAPDASWKSFNFSLDPTLVDMLRG